MTSVSEAAKTGNGKILANFREIPAPSRATVEEKITMLKEAGIGGVYALGNTSEPICQVEVRLLCHKDTMNATLNNLTQYILLNG